MKRIRALLQIAVMSLVVMGSVGAATLVLPSTSAYAQTAKDQVCTAIESCDDGGSNISGILKNIINLLSVLGGIIAVIMIIIGGIKYITSDGDSSKISSAKNTIIYAIVGLIIVAMAQVIVHFVISSVR